MRWARPASSVAARLVPAGAWRGGAGPCGRLGSLSAVISLTESSGGNNSHFHYGVRGDGTRPTAGVARQPGVAQLGDDAAGGGEDAVRPRRPSKGGGDADPAAEIPRALGDAPGVGVAAAAARRRPERRRAWRSAVEWGGEGGGTMGWRPGGGAAGGCAGCAVCAHTA